MSLPVSPHSPILAGGIETVIGSKEVDTGLRDIQSFAATINSASSPNAQVAWSLSSFNGSSKKVNIQVGSVTVLGVASTGSITTVTKAELLDTDYFTMGDGVSAAKVFEFDVTGNGGTAGRVIVDVSGTTTANDVRDALIAAINRVPNFYILASSGGAATVTLTNKLVGTAGNVTNSDNVVDVDFVISNMTGGVNAAATGATANVSWIALGK